VVPRGPLRTYLSTSKNEAMESSIRAENYFAQIGGSFLLTCVHGCYRRGVTGALAKIGRGYHSTCRWQAESERKLMPTDKVRLP